MQPPQDAEFKAFGGRGHRLGSQGEIIPSPNISPAGVTPVGVSGSSTDRPVHPLLVPPVVEVEEEEDGGADDGVAGNPLQDPPEDSFISDVELASKHIKNMENMMVVVQSWIMQLDDGKWNQKLKSDATQLYKDMEAFELFAHGTAWTEGNMCELLESIERAHSEFTNRVTTLKQYMPKTQLKADGVEKTENGDGESGDVDVKKLFAKSKGSSESKPKSGTGKGKSAKAKKGKGNDGKNAGKVAGQGKGNDTTKTAKAKAKSKALAKRPACAKPDGEEASETMGEDSSSDEMLLG